MQVRFSTVFGTPVVDEEMTEQLGTLSGMFIHPDTGKIEGFFVRIPGFFHAEHLFLSVQDILRWGLRVVVREADVLSPIEDRVRLQSLHAEGRTFLGQLMLTESGTRLGVCADVQFDTNHFSVDWLWPKKWWRWGSAIPASHVIEVRKDAIIVRDLSLPIAEESPEPAMLNRLPDAA